MAERYNEVANRLTSTRSDASNPAVNHIVSGADEIYDDVAPYRINGHIQCTAVTPVGTENPVELRWYEKVYDTQDPTLFEWELSDDTIVDAQKTYGLPNGAKQSDINNQLYTMVGDITGVTITPSGEVISPDENKIIDKEDGYIPTAGAVGRALGANFEDNLTSTSTVKGLTANQGRVLNEKKSDKNGWYEQLVAGASLSVIGDDTDDKAKFFYRETGDSTGTGGDTGGSKHTIEKGTAIINEIRGNTVKFNQLLNNGNFSSSSGWFNGVPGAGYFSNIAVQDGVLTVEKNNSSGVGGLCVYNASNRFTTEHKYFIKVIAKSNTSEQRAFIYFIRKNLTAVSAAASTDSQTYLPIAVVATPPSNDSYLCLSSGNAYSSNGTSCSFKNVISIDLTALGYPNISTTTPTVAEVEAWLTQNVGYQDYYPYNAGSLISLKPNKLISTGANLYNPTTGTARVLSGKQYKLTGTNTGAAYSDGTAITLSDSLFTASKDDTITISGGNSTSTFLYLVLNNDTSKTFEPYKTSEVDLSWIMDIPDPNDNTKKLFPYGLLSADSVCDEVRGNKVIKRIGSVDLGTIDWVYNGNYFVTPASSIQPIPNAYNSNGICIKYAVKNLAALTIADDKTIGLGSILTYIRDTAYTNAATFKTAVNGVPLFYELDTPIEVTFEEPDTHPMNYEVEPGGTEEFVKADAALGENEPTSTSLTATITYPLDLLGTLKNLKYNFTTLGALGKSFTSLVNALNSLLSDLGRTEVFSVEESEDDPGEYTFTYDEPESSNSVENESI